MPEAAIEYLRRRCVITRPETPYIETIAQIQLTNTEQVSLCF